MTQESIMFHMLHVYFNGDKLKQISLLKKIKIKRQASWNTVCSKFLIELNSSCTHRGVGPTMFGVGQAELGRGQPIDCHSTRATDLCPNNCRAGQSSTH